MNSNKIVLLALCIFVSSCSKAPQGGSNTISGLPNGTTLTPISGPNVLTLTVNGSTCASNSYPNKPCVAVTVCTPGFSDSAHCDTVNDILVDTGSYGLRIFGSTTGVLNHAVPTSITAGVGTLAECAQFGDGSKLWGPVKTANVILGSEAAVQVPIQIIDSTFSNGMSANCSGASTNPGNGSDSGATIYAGFNGILGVGLAKQDCGASCVSGTGGAPSLYYSCDGSTCTATYTALANQVINPVAAEATDNNGVIVELPYVTQAASSSGYLVLGIGTQANNIPSGVTKFASDGNAEMTTTFEGHTYTSFIDSGSNALYFPSPGTNLPDCGATNSSFMDWYCPSSVTLFSATNKSADGKNTGLFQFNVSNFISFYNSTNDVDSQMAASSSSGITGSFDIGLPFFFGRNVYIGIDTKTSSIGTGPYWAY